MSINIPAETPDESTNPISVEEFERLHPAMLGAIRKAVREEPARTVIGTVGDDRRIHLSSLDLRGIGPKFVKVGRTVMYPKEPMIAYFKEHLSQSTCEYEGKESA